MGEGVAAVGVFAAAGCHRNGARHLAALQLAVTTLSVYTNDAVFLTAPIQPHPFSHHAKSLPKPQTRPKLREILPLTSAFPSRYSLTYEIRTPGSNSIYSIGFSIVSALCNPAACFLPSHLSLA